ncbi:pbn1 [Fusarium longipes]|uniref:Protein PBN1 n=1 Tax=Fusarium longipes TaxID=694270 RepID=A0A395SBZ3_9HYPO|nr:pbn1 [Fusarium longipes]
MRERVTFIHNDYTLDPEALDNQEAGLLGPQIETIRQDKLTIPFGELPRELTDILQEYEALHIKWASPIKSETMDPFTSRISPGLHVYATPVSPNSCNPWLQRFGPLDCSKPDWQAFTEFQQTASISPNFLFYQALEDLHSFITTSSQEFCPELDSVCNARLRSLLTAASLDLSFDKTTNALVASALWPLRPQTVAVPASTARRVEVGIFVKDQSQPNMKENELGVAGVLSVLGDQKKPSPTIFTFPARHRRDESVFNSKFLTPTGLHPTLRLTFSSNKLPSADSECAPYAFLTLPKTIFADRYQLGDDLFLASKNLTALRYTTLPVDLEAPTYTTETWGSSILLGLAPPDSSIEQPWSVEIPLHLRYLKPSASGQAEIEIPFPAVFWACSSGEETLESPFDRLHMGYDVLFPRDTVFWHVNPNPEGGSRLMNTVTVPVLNDEGELRSIKEAVHPKNNVEPVSVSQSQTTAFPTPAPSANNIVFPLSNHLQSPQPESFTPVAPLLQKAEPTKSRIINGQVVSGQDIDWYFENWPFPTIRFVTDPSPTFISSALNACMLLGLHTGRGSHPSFLIGGRQHMTCTDYEASITWMFCCILAQRFVEILEQRKGINSANRASTANGHPPPFLQHNDTRCKDTVKDTLAPELMTLFELQKFSNRLHTAMAAQILSNDGVPETVVKTWEDEFELIRPLVTHIDTDCSQLITLMTQLEVQAYYFVSLPDQRPNFSTNTLRAYNTSQNLINTVLTLESTSKLVTHSTHWIYRAVMDASCILISTLHSKASPPHISASDADAVVAQILAVLRVCSVRDNDLPVRGSVVFETFWSVRHILPKWDIPVGAWPDRIGAATSYWCLARFKQALQEAKNGTDAAQKGTEVYESNLSTANETNDDNVVANPDLNHGQNQIIDSTVDPLQGVDWSMIIDDFGWIGEGPVFLGPA